MKKEKNFLRDKEIGNKGEILFLQILEKAGLKAEKNSDKKSLKYWDVKTDCGFLFEIKYDLYSARSGNIAIEFFNPKTAQFSGLTATKAHFWIQTLPDETAWMTPVSKLKTYCSSTKPLKVIAAGGDDNSSMYIYKKDLILDSIFARIDESNITRLIEEAVNEKFVCLFEPNSH